jgi:hypothetical protein
VRKFRLLQSCSNFNLLNRIFSNFCPRLWLSFSQMPVSRYVASRTLVSPLERLKIIQYVDIGFNAWQNLGWLTFSNRQVQGASGGGRTYNGVWDSLVRMWKEEGIRGYMRGNGVNCLRIVP